MILYPNAKINIGLRILSKRTDGFHNIETCFYPISLCDILEFQETKSKIKFNSSGILIPGNNPDNICIKAWELLHEQYAIPPVEIHLHKIIPIGAGLGGGSSDGAFMLKGLVDYFKLEVSSEQILHLASKLGSDCSFFIKNSPSIGIGRGEILEPLQTDIEKFKVVVVNPGIHISTATAYAGVQPSISDTKLVNHLNEPMNTWMANVSNDFEKGIFKEFPEIEIVKTKLLDLGADYASMSGSGSTVFGLFTNTIPSELKKVFQEYFVYVEE